MSYKKTITAAELMKHMPANLTGKQFNELTLAIDSFTIEEAAVVLQLATAIAEETTPQFKYCRALKGNHTCRTQLNGDGVHATGFCEDCWYPEIRQDYSYYSELRKEGMGRNQAARTAGILQAVGA